MPKPLQAPDQRVGLRALFTKRTMFTLSLLLALSIFAVVRQRPFFPIKVVSFKGDDATFAQDELQQRLLPYVSHGFFSVSVSAIKQQLDQLSWIESSQVTRIWPDQVEVTVFRRHPVLRWNEQGLLTEKNDLFFYNDLNTEHAMLPQLCGAEHERDVVFLMYTQMQALFDTVDLKIATLCLDDQDHWQVNLSNGLQLIMHKNQSMEAMQKFVRAYHQNFYQKVAGIERVDLRYPNGFAIRWKKT